MTEVKAIAVNGKSQSASLSKNAKRRQKKKERKTTNGSQITSSIIADREVSQPLPTVAPSTIDFSISTAEEEAALAAFSDVFKRFQSDPSSSKGVYDPSDEKGQVIYSDDEQLSESDEEEALEQEKLSKRRQRKLQRLTVAELKQIVKRPELVDAEDVTATDPAFLVQIKSTRNTIPVPPHWNLKREYLQNKKGIEKPPFQLPSYIAATGIAEIKDALKEKESEQSLKAKTRERVQPKMGKVMIDYQKLHDAFFRFQTKPESLTRFGEVYYEGKEFETKFKERKPGELSDALKDALSIPPLAPPPWLIAMQRFGPPPSYPQLRIPGLNAPIPEGAQWVSIRVAGVVLRWTNMAILYLVTFSVIQKMYHRVKLQFSAKNQKRNISAILIPKRRKKKKKRRRRMKVKMGRTARKLKKKMNILRTIEEGLKRPLKVYRRLVAYRVLQAQFLVVCKRQASWRYVKEVGAVNKRMKKIVSVRNSYTTFYLRRMFQEQMDSLLQIMVMILQVFAKAMESLQVQFWARKTREEPNERRIQGY
ncbi:hypothetical protein L7F22_068197 [Adiantum nelumboides]|nr:hypothetical protein [Adiantum nelumboides]